MNILLPTDGSPPSAAAIAEVRQRCWPEGSRVRVLSVVQHPTPPPVGEFVMGMADDMDEMLKQEKQRAEKIAGDAASSLEGSGLAVEKTVLEGDPDDTIVEEAERWPADLIVMGTHGYRGFKKLVLGSVAQKVLSHAPCSVEVVRERAAA